MAENGEGPNTDFLRAVLRWSLQQQDLEGGNEVKAMSSEDREFLSKAMARVQSAPSEVDVIKEQLEMLRRPVDTSLTDGGRQQELERREEAVEMLTDLCDNVDNANDMIPLCGFPVIKALLLGENNSLVWRAGDLVATLAQNNPVCQMAIVESGLVPILMEKLRTSDVASVRVKSLYAISCVVKDHAEAHEQFVRNDGYRTLVDCLSSDVEKLLVKAVFLMGNLCESHEKAADTLCEVRVVETLGSFLGKEHAAWHEHVARTLLSLANHSSRCRQRCRQPDLHVEQAVHGRLKFLLQNCGEEAADEKDYCKQLLLLLRE